MAYKERFRDRWRVVERIDGKKVPKYFKTEDQADEWLRFVRTHPLVGGYRPATVFQLVENVLSDRGGRKPKPKKAPLLKDYAKSLVAADHELGRGSRDGYEAVIRNHVEQTRLGGMSMTDIEVKDIRDYWEKVGPTKAGPAGGKGARGNVHRLMAKVFNAAEKDGTRRPNPWKLAGIKRPSRKRTTEVTPLDVEQIETLADATGDDSDRLCILVSAYVGLRAGEVGGLRRRDVDAKKCQVSVQQAVIRDRGGLHLGPPKYDSKRKLTAACSLVEEIADFLRSNPPASDGRIFHRDGEMMDHIKLNKACQRAATRANLGPINFHQLRHTCASLLIDDGANAKAVQQYMGHSSIQVTMDLYGHLFENYDQELAASMDRRREEYRRVHPSDPGSA